VRIGYLKVGLYLNFQQTSYFKKYAQREGREKNKKILSWYLEEIKLGCNNIY